MTSLGTKCPVCGFEGISWRVVPKYRYTESGLDNVWLVGGGVRQAKCPSCREKLTHVEAEWQLQQVIAIVLLRKQGLLAGAETRFLREAANLTQEELATHLDVKRQPTISDRERTDGPAMKYTEDLGFRVVILHQLLRFLTENPKENFLSKAHFDILKNVASWLTDKAEELLAAKQAKQELQLQRDDSIWTAETLKEAA
jgi:transcriptional regulator with XRE-family HTH domain